MSIKLDEGKLKFIYDSDYKSKTNYSLSKKSNKNQTQKQQQIHLLKTYIGLSPNKTNSKKKTLLKTYNNSSLYQVNNNKNSNLKNVKSKKLKYNRSFEGGIIKNKVIDYNNDNDIEQINDRNHFGTTNRKKNKSNSKYNNKTHIFSSVNKSKTNNRINNKNNNNIIKKLDEQFKSLENNIIDKKYENDIDHDEIIMTTNRKTEDKSNESKNNNYILNVNNFNIDENLINSSFENNKNDFKIMYVENYSIPVPDDMLILEIKLIFEKTLELQKSYHIELDNILYHYFINKKEYKNIISKYDEIKKKICVLQKINEKKYRLENENCFDIHNKRNFQDIIDINKNEFNIWKIMMNLDENKNKNKEKLKEIFKISVFEKYYKIKNLNDVEKKIILNLMKKNKFFLQNENEINKIKNTKSNNSLKKYSNKKILSPIVQKNNIGYLSNNKYRNKKVSNHNFKGKK